MNLNFKRPEIIRLEDDSTEILITGNEYLILIRDSKPGSLYRDGEYGHTSS